MTLLRLTLVAALLAMAGCSALGESCAKTADCEQGLVCFDQTCSEDCTVGEGVCDGDGYRLCVDDDGFTEWAYRECGAGSTCVEDGDSFECD